MMAKIRLDEYLIKQGLLPDKDAALRSVIAGKVLVDDVVASSAAMKIASDAEVRIRGTKQFVSRGGHKLQAALDAFGTNVEGANCIDVGSSTGGFTDCLLQAGAAHVACVDVNYGQLDWKIRNDPRVAVFERTNIKTVDPADLGAPFDIVVIDVSFIGLAQLAPVLATLCKKGSQLLALVKPQFESAHDETDHGVVRDEAVRLRTVDEVSEALTANGFDVQGFIESPVKGPAGNIEYLISAVYGNA